MAVALHGPEAASQPQTCQNRDKKVQKGWIQTSKAGAVFMNKIAAALFQGMVCPSTVMQELDAFNPGGLLFVSHQKRRRYGCLAVPPRRTDSRHHRAGDPARGGCQAFRERA